MSKFIRRQMFRFVHYLRHVRRCLRTSHSGILGLRCPHWRHVITANRRLSSSPALTLHGRYSFVQLVDLLLRLRVGRQRVQILQLLLHPLNLAGRIHHPTRIRSLRPVAHGDRLAVSVVKRLRLHERHRIVLLLLLLLLSHHHIWIHRWMLAVTDGMQLLRISHSNLRRCWMLLRYHVLLLLLLDMLRSRSVSTHSQVSCRMLLLLLLLLVMTSRRMVLLLSKSLLISVLLLLLYNGWRLRNYLMLHWMLLLLLMRHTSWLIWCNRSVRHGWMHHRQRTLLRSRMLLLLLLSHRWVLLLLLLLLLLMSS